MTILDIQNLVNKLGGTTHISSPYTIHIYKDTVYHMTVYVSKKPKYQIKKLVKPDPEFKIIKQKIFELFS